MSKTPNSKMPEYSGKDVDLRRPPTSQPSAAPPAFYDRGVEWRTFLWNPKTKEFLGRNAQSWGKITAFYVVFYAFLAGYFAFMMTVLYHTLEDDRPKYTSHGGQSILKAPGLGMRPDYRPSDLYHLMEYDPNNEDSYVEYVNSINDLLAGYDGSSDNIPDCKTKLNIPCGFDVTSLRNSQSTWNATTWGYSTASPVVILKLNKVFDWVPKPYNANADALPEGLRNYINETMDVTAQPQMVWVWCETKEEGVSFTYTPYPGFPVYYYPFVNQQGFLSPIVAVHIKDLPAETEVRVSCEAYAKNVKEETLLFTWKVKQDPH